MRFLINLMLTLIKYCYTAAVYESDHAKTHIYKEENMFDRPKSPLQHLPDSYSARAQLTKNELAKSLFLLMDERKTNLCLSADVTTSKELLDLAENIGPYICVLKTHIDILRDFTPETTVKLQEIAERLGFIIFEDRKFADIGQTALWQYEGGMYQIAKWAKITNAHTVPGKGLIDALAKVGGPLGNGLLLLAEMSSEGNLATGSYTQASIEMAEKSDFVIGFITRRVLSDQKRLINFTPGIQIGAKAGALGQTYIEPEDAFKAGTDIQIIGSGIYGKKTLPEVIDAAKLYRDVGWKAYQNRIKPVNKIENASANFVGLSLTNT
jgi:orotidine 5'-phosphate decarboxylase subfamily 1